MADNQSNIVSLSDRKADDGDPIFKVNKNPDYQACRHKKFIVDVATDTVECGDCHKVLSPMWVLVQLSDNHNYLCRRYHEITAITEKAQAKNRCKCEKCGQMTRIVK